MKKYLEIPDEHVPLLSKVKKWFIALDNSDAMFTVKEYQAFMETIRIYKKYGYRSMRFAWNNARGKQSFISHCKKKSESIKKILTLNNV